MPVETRPSYCRFCFNACAMLVDVDSESGQALSVRGDKSNPVYQGYFCVKGQQLVAAQPHPDRLLHSMKRSDADEVVEIQSDHATIYGIVEVDESVREGLISMSHSFGDVPERDGDLREIGSNTGRLRSVDRDYDRFSGLPRMSNIPVRIERAQIAN